MHRPKGTSVLLTLGSSDLDVFPVYRSRGDADGAAPASMAADYLNDAGFAVIGELARSQTT
jgi:hypothetical protein